MNRRIQKMKLPAELVSVIDRCPNLIIPTTKDELARLTFGSTNVDSVDVVYNVEGEIVKEATVVRCKNGVVVNYMEDYMRRRDPECMVIADDLPTDKVRYSDRYENSFDDTRAETFEWLAKQELLVLPFLAGGVACGYDALLVCPSNAAFFAAGLADLQKFISIDDVTDRTFTPRAIIYLAPPFRHTHFDGKQVVVHNRLDNMHEMFAYNLYPGPSAKKGVYGALLTIGEQEGWLTAHASAVRVITPYNNETVIMHEGASGGGKSEMLEHFHRLPDGRLQLGKHVVTGEAFKLNMNDSSKLMPIADDMATCHPDLQNDSGKLVISDGENGWFLRVDNICDYGTDPVYEKLSIHPKEPLVFFNIQGQPNSTALIWEHAIDSTGEPCPNPRVIIPRDHIPNIQSEPLEVDVRSFGVRMPPSTLENPSYGIMGLIQVVPPALAWIWRLVSPRGYKNPSIVDVGGMSAEGVGSYWPFATGRKVTQANLLLKQIAECPKTNYVLIPNQHIGVYKVGFAPEWVAREYLSHLNGGKIKDHLLQPARCSILGYSLTEMQVEGQQIRRTFLQPEIQSKLTPEGYDIGAKILVDFFKEELKQYLVDELDPRGRAIIECCLNDGSVKDYEALL